MKNRSTDYLQKKKTASFDVSQQGNEGVDTQQNNVKIPPKMLTNGFMTVDGKWVFVREVNENKYMWTVSEFKNKKYEFRDLEAWNHKYINFKQVQELCQNHHIGILGHDDILKIIKNLVENVNLSSDAESRKKCEAYIDAFLFLFGKDGQKKIEELFEDACANFYEKFFDKSRR